MTLIKYKDFFNKIFNSYNLNNLQEILKEFVFQNFDKEGTELGEHTPADWQSNPDFIHTIEDGALKDLAIEMNNIWKKLTRKIAKDKTEIEAKSSLIYLEHPFVVPGGRFREVYYWDSYWTVKGLLLCKMFDTTKELVSK